MLEIQLLVSSRETYTGLKFENLCTEFVKSLNPNMILNSDNELAFW